ncbi:MAG TPA: hypothetical protein VMW56_25200 [Candidatus Margulisiibacteriota bacterium]|nr:hypothetical protein [Candidatus Margulisiibacteriota bacterium]
MSVGGGLTRRRATRSLGMRFALSWNHHDILEATCSEDGGSEVLRPAVLNAGSALRLSAARPSAAMTEPGVTNTTNHKRTINHMERRGIMKTRKVSSGDQLETGAAILAAAKVVDTDLVKARLAAFASAQRSYAEAQAQVEAAEARLKEEQIRLARRDAEQDEATEELARALVSSGQPRGNPFTAFGTAAPSAVKQLPPVTEAKTIRQLVAAVQRQKPVSKATSQAAQAAEQAARQVETAQLAVDKFQEALSHARHARDGIGETWERTLAALKRGVRAAADDGAPGLYTALFGNQRRSSNKAVKPSPAAAAAPAPTATTAA